MGEMCAWCSGEPDIMTLWEHNASVWDRRVFGMDSPRISDQQYAHHTGAQHTGAQHTGAHHIGTHHIGTRLARARLSKALSLADVSRALGIKPEFLDAIERLDLQPLPSRGYALGYVRNYAGFLGLDVQAMVTSFKREIENPNGLADILPGAVGSQARTDLRRGGLLASLVVIGACVLIAPFGFKTKTVAAETIRGGEKTRVETRPVKAARNRAAKPVIRAETISLKAVSASWVEVVDAKGAVLISRIMVPGEIFEVARSARPLLSLRDAGAIELFIGGERIGPIGQKGAPASNIPLAEVMTQ